MNDIERAVEEFCNSLGLDSDPHVTSWCARPHRIREALTTLYEQGRKNERERIFKELNRMKSVYETMDTGSALKALQTTPTEPLQG